MVSKRTSSCFWSTNEACRTPGNPHPQLPAAEFPVSQRQVTLGDCLTPSFPGTYSARRFEGRNARTGRLAPGFTRHLPRDEDEEYAPRWLREGYMMHGSIGPYSVHYTGRGFEAVTGSGQDYIDKSQPHGHLYITAFGVPIGKTRSSTSRSSPSRTSSPRRRKELLALPGREWLRDDKDYYDALSGGSGEVRQPHRQLGEKPLPSPPWRRIAMTAWEARPGGQRSLLLSMGMQRLCSFSCPHRGPGGKSH
jgi:hypothetical protein